MLGTYLALKWKDAFARMTAAGAQSLSGVSPAGTAVRVWIRCEQRPLYCDLQSNCRAHPAPRQPRPARPRPAQASLEPAQQRACRGSGQCTRVHMHACPSRNAHKPTPRRVTPTQKPPPRATGTPRRAPHLSRAAADRLKSTRHAPARVWQDLDANAAPALRRCAKASQGALSPAPAAPIPTPPGASVLRAGAAARTPRQPVHTCQPLAESVPAPRRAESRRPRNSRAAGTPRRAPHLSRAARTTETDAERAGVFLDRPACSSATSALVASSASRTDRPHACRVSCTHLASADTGTFSSQARLGDVQSWHKLLRRCRALTTVGCVHADGHRRLTRAWCVSVNSSTYSRQPYITIVAAPKNRRPSCGSCASQGVACPTVFQVVKARAFFRL